MTLAPALAGAVGFGSSLNPMLQGLHDSSTHEFIVFADTGRERHGIDLAAQQEEVRTEDLLDAVNEHTEGEFGSLVAVLALLVNVTHVGRTAESLKAGLLVHEGIHFLRSEALLLHDEGNDGRVESAQRVP